MEIVSIQSIRRDLFIRKALNAILITLTLTTVLFIAGFYFSAFVLHNEHAAKEEAQLRAVSSAAFSTALAEYNKVPGRHL